MKGFKIVKKGKKRSFEWLRWTAVVVLLLVSIVLIFNQQIKYYLVGSYKPEITRQTVQNNQKKKATYDFQSVEDLNLQTAAKARANKQSINTIGAITVPAINMTIPPPPKLIFYQPRNSRIILLFIKG